MLLPLDDPLLAWWSWDPDPVAFTLPWIGIRVAWYGIFFAVGCWMAYLVIERVFERYLQQLPPPTSYTGKVLAEKFIWWGLIGTLVGARLGHVLFYQWDYYALRPLDIFKIWEGGLASHGAMLGLLFAAWAFRWKIASRTPQVTFLRILDAIAVPAGFTAACIRVGNFFNQEIIGIQTKVAWAVIFVSPVEGVGKVPRHPVQLYEAAAYLLIGAGVFYVWKTRPLQPPGRLAGYVLVLTGIARFAIEFFKFEQTPPLFATDPFSMGQYLTLPFMVIGVILIFNARFKG